MRRLPSVVLATLLAALLLAPTAAGAAPATDGPAGTEVSAGTGIVVLAAEGGGGEPQGPEPMAPDNPENSNAPADYEPPFLINAAVGLAALMILLVVGLGGLYWLLVQRPRQASGA